jgi:DNA-binding IclR family transcriptional regulator
VGEKSGGKPRETRSVTGRALAVLDTFDTKHRRQSLAAIARRAGMPLTTAHRLVHDLEKHEALIRRTDGDYEIGSKVWQWGILASVHADLREVAMPYMEDMYQVDNDAVQIAVLDGFKCLIVERVAGLRTVATLSKPGSRLPLHASGAGKVLLAYGNQELQDAVLNSLDRYTDKTITDVETLRKQLVAIKQQGYAATDEELMAGQASIAVPVRGNGGRVIAALGLISSSSSGELSRMIPALHVTAAALSKKLIESGLGDAEI